MSQNSHQPSTDGLLLLLGNYRAALAVARELAPLGHTVMVTRGGGEGAAELSRHVREVWDEPCIKAHSEAAFVDALADLLDANPDIRTILPVAEPYVVALARHGHRLPPDRLLATPPPETVFSCLDKPSLFDKADAENIPFAPTAIVSNHADLRAQATKLGYPIVIRPLVSETRLVGEKALVLEDESALLEALPAWPAPHDDLIVQSKVCGLRVNLYFAASKGTLVRALQATILKTDRADGSGLAVAGTTEPVSPDLLDYTRRMLAALNYHGVGCAQFLVDRATGAVNFLEINPRIAGHHAVTTRAGLDLASLALKLAAGETVDNFQAGQSGIRYTWTYGALRGVRQRAPDGRQALKDSALALWRAARSDLPMTWQWSDPKPTLALYARGLRGNRALKAPKRASPQLRPRKPGASNV